MRSARFFLIPLLVLTLAACSSEEQPVKNVDRPDTTEDAQTPQEGVRPVTAEKLDLNTTSKEEFMTIPGVGERMAHEFEEYRPYTSIVEFRREMAKYVDAETIAGYEEHVYVPIDINASDAETVAQILGMDLEQAQTLIERRPYADEAAFTAAIIDVTNDGVTAQFARLYIAR